MRRITIGVVVLLVCLGVAALAQPYGARVTCSQLSSNTWNYTIYNTSTSSYYRLLGVGFESRPEFITVPDGWWADWNGKNGMVWIVLGEGGGPYCNSCIWGVEYTSDTYEYIAPGEALNIIYDYGSPRTYAEIRGTWWALFSGPSIFTDCTGYVELEDSTVPEPMSIIALAISLVPLGSRVLRRKLA